MKYNDVVLDQPDVFRDDIVEDTYNKHRILEQFEQLELDSDAKWILFRII